jgi:effector-binding domain-containing protein
MSSRLVLPGPRSSFIWRETLRRKEQDHGNGEEGDEPYRRAQHCDLAGNSLRFYREDWTLPGQCTASLAEPIPGILEHNKITGYTSLFKVGPKIYRAGVSLAAEPKNLPANLKYEKFKGGKYSRFVLTGPYSNLPEACRRVFEIVAEKKISMRDDYCVENYTNDPRTTPEEQLVTEILIPMA